jgi:hypothetical protein
MSTPTTPSTRPAIWAEAGTVVNPSTGLQQSGYVAGKPGRGVTNWLLNWLDNAVQWLLVTMLMGIANYDGSKDYAVGARVQDATSHKTYRCTNANGPSTAVKPVTDTGFWIPWGHTDAEVNSQVDAKIGTLSGSATTLTPNNGATVFDAHHFNAPGTTHKQIAFRLRVVVGSDFTAAVVLSGDALFNTGAKHVFASISDNQFSPSSLGVIGWLVDGSTIHVMVTGIGTEGGGPTTCDVDVLVTGW